MKIKVGKLETPYHKMQLKFAGLESLMTENLHEQLIKPAVSHKVNRKSTNEVNQLNHGMSKMMAQEEAHPCTPNDSVAQRVKKLM